MALACGPDLLIADEPTTALDVTIQAQILELLDELKRESGMSILLITHDPYGSIDPRWTIERIIAEPLVITKGQSAVDLKTRVRALLDQVGLDPAIASRYPHACSGGQRQRIGIARALASSPRFIVADEPVSALDVSVQAQIVNLLDDVKARLGIGFLFIGHGLHVVRHLSDRVGVMYLGQLVEVAPSDDIFRWPAHPYTRALASAVPIPIRAFALRVSLWPVSCRRRRRRPQAAAFTPDARRPPLAAGRSSRLWCLSVPVDGRPATTRCRQLSNREANPAASDDDRDPHGERNAAREARAKRRLG